MDIWIGIAALAVLVIAWRAVARVFRRQGRSAALCHLAGVGAGALAFVLVLVAGIESGAISGADERPPAAAAEDPAEGGPAQALQGAASEDETPELVSRQPLPPLGPPLDGNIPYGIETMFGNESPSIHAGTLTIYLAVDRKVSPEILRWRVASLCMARWSAPDVPDEDGEMSPPKLTAPAWVGITRLRLLDRDGIRGLAFAGGDAECDAMPERDEAARRAYIEARTEPAHLHVPPATAAGDTLHFLTAARETLQFAIEAGDGQSVRSQIYLPSIGVGARWHGDAIAGDIEPYSACAGAVEALNRLTAALLDATDSAERRRAIARNSERFDAQYAGCSDLVANRG